jgi:hypothetical protein
MRGDFVGLLLLILASALVSLPLLSLAMTPRWRRNWRRLRRRLLGQSWKPVFIEPHPLSQPKNPSGPGQ